MDVSLLNILTCPQCHSELYYRPGMEEIVCRADRLGFPIKQGKPIMLVEQARELSPTEMQELPGRKQ